MKNFFENGFEKIFLPLFLLLGLLLWVGCGPSGGSSEVPSDESSALVSEVPESAEIDRSEPESSAPIDEASVYYSLALDAGEARAIITDEGGILLPDGRTVTKEGFLLPDGTLVEEDLHFVLTGDSMGGILTLSDGTQIDDPYYVPYLDTLDTFPPIYYRNTAGDGDDRDMAWVGNNMLRLPDGRIMTPNAADTAYLLRLPDGTETEAEFILPDGTVSGGLITDDFYSYEPKRSNDGALILRDGTRIIDPSYGTRISWLVYRGTTDGQRLSKAD